MLTGLVKQNGCQWESPGGAWHRPAQIKHPHLWTWPRERWLDWINTPTKMSIRAHQGLFNGSYRLKLNVCSSLLHSLKTFRHSWVVCSRTEPISCFSTDLHFSWLTGAHRRGLPPLPPPSRQYQTLQSPPLSFRDLSVSLIHSQKVPHLIQAGSASDKQCSSLSASHYRCRYLLICWAVAVETQQCRGNKDANGEAGAGRV